MNMKKFDRRDIKHMCNYFAEIRKSDYFIDKFTELRKKLNIPNGGFIHKTEKLPGAMPVSGWKEFELYSLKKKFYISICKKLNLNIWEWEAIFDSFLYYNSFKISENDFLRSFNMCISRDIVLDKMFEMEEGEFIDTELESFENTYPIAIRISPYASKRSILDYVNKAYDSEIKPLQKTHKDNSSKIGKFRKRDPKKRERDDFIFQNKDLKVSELMEKFDKKYEKEVLAYEDIPKIIKKEQKRRQMFN